MDTYKKNTFNLLIYIIIDYKLDLCIIFKIFARLPADHNRKKSYHNYFYRHTVEKSFQHSATPMDLIWENRHRLQNDDGSQSGKSS